MTFLQGIGLAEGGHIRTQVIEPDFAGIALVLTATGEEQHIGFNALGIEDAGRQAKDGMQIAFLHQVTADALTITIGEKDIVR